MKFQFLLIPLFGILPNFVLAQNGDGPGGTEVWPGTKVYYGTKSNRVDINGDPTWDYYDMTPWESSSYIDYTFNYFSWQFPVNFRLKYPVDYFLPQNENNEYPIHIFFHGAGEGGIEWAGYEPDDPRYLNNDHQLYHGGRIVRDWIDRKEFTVWNTPVRLMSMVWFHCSVVIFSIEAKCPTPALAMTTSIFPHWSRIACTAASWAAASRTSATNPMALLDSI